MKSTLLKLDTFINDKTLESDDFVKKLQSRYLAVSLLFVFCTSPLFAYLDSLDVGFLSVLNSSNIVLFSGSLTGLYLLNKSPNTLSSALTLILITHFAVFVTAWQGRGVLDTSTVWLLFGPLAATLFHGKNLALVSTTLSFMLMAALYILHPETNNFFRWQDYLASLFFSCLFSYSFNSIIEITHSQFLEIQTKLLKEKQHNFQTQKILTLAEMAGGIAHEVNNPLAILKGLIFRLKVERKKNQLSNEVFDQLTSKMVTVISRIAKIIHGLRKFSRDGSKDDFNEVDLSEVVDETLDLYGEKIKNSGVLISHKKPSQRLMTHCRDVQISQVILNLLANSLDAIKNLDEKWIRIEYGVSGKMVQVFVTDSGSGVDKEIADRIFNPFFTTKPVGSGTGIGLSISHGIIEDHGGGN